MSELKTKCATCGTTILQRTASRHDGRCLPCHRRWMAIPPPGFEVPRDVAERLVALNERPANYRQMAWRRGVAFVHGFLDRLEDRNRLYDEWSPRLRAFANKCRQDHPSPGGDSLSNRDRAMQRIYRIKFMESPVTPQGMVAICCMPVLAIPVAQHAWPVRDQRIVLLTPEEKSQWEEIYAHPEHSLQWFAHYWWHIDDSAGQGPRANAGLTMFRWREQDAPDGVKLWVVSVGESYGPLAGAGRGELWSWNGQRASFVRNVGEWSS
jgi:hypothetical protein